MSAEKVTSETLIKDLSRERTQFQKLLSKVERNINFQKIVGDVLDAQGYNYELEFNGNFQILNDHGMKIIGKWNGIGWDLCIQTSYGGRSSGDFDMKIQLSPAGFSDYVPLFNSMLSKLDKLFDKYEKSTKANKSGQLLEILLPELLSSLNMGDTIVEPNSDNKGLLRVSKRLGANLYLSTSIKFENYETRCQELKNAWEFLPAIVKDNRLHSVYFKKRSERWPLADLRHTFNRYEKALNKPLKICYDFECKIERIQYDRSAYCDIEILDYLNKLDYCFYVLDFNSIKILVGRGLYLHREGGDTWFVCSSGRGATKRINVSKDLFIQLLYYIALTSMSRGSFWGPYWDADSPNTTEFYRCFEEIINYCCPCKVFSIPYFDRQWFQLLQDYDAKEGIRLRSNRPDLLAPLLYAIENYDILLGLPKIFEDSEFKNIKIRIEPSY